MRGNEKRPTGALSEAGGPIPTVRLAVDLRDVETAMGWPTFEGTREAVSLLDQALGAPRGAELVLRVGVLRPGLSVPEVTWRALLERFVVTIEAEAPSVAFDWHNYARVVLGGGAHA